MHIPNIGDTIVPINCLKSLADSSSKTIPCFFKASSNFCQECGHDELSWVSRSAPFTRNVSFPSFAAEVASAENAARASMLASPIFWISGRANLPGRKRTSAVLQLVRISILNPSFSCISLGVSTRRSEAVRSAFTGNPRRRATSPAAKSASERFIPQEVLAPANLRPTSSNCVILHSAIPQRCSSCRRSHNSVPPRLIPTAKHPYPES